MSMKKSAEEHHCSELEEIAQNPIFYRLKPVMTAALQHVESCLENAWITSKSSLTILDLRVNNDANQCEAVVCPCYGWSGGCKLNAWIPCEGALLLKPKGWFMTKERIDLLDWPKSWLAPRNGASKSFWISPILGWLNCLILPWLVADPCGARRETGSEVLSPWKPKRYESNYKSRQLSLRLMLDRA